MVRRAVVLGLVGVAGVALGLVGVAGVALGACGGVDGSSGGPNAPCTRDYDCASGLSCASGVCVGPVDDAGAPAEAGPRDASGDG